MSSATEKNCANCNAVFACGPAHPDERCWCEHLPHVPLVAAEGADCLCPPCLEEAIARHNGSSETSIKNNGSCLPQLREGEDYYLDGAAIVFTARYHLRRGYCCESGCRHCPYRSIEMTKEA